MLNIDDKTNIIYTGNKSSSNTIFLDDYEFDCQFDKVILLHKDSFVIKNIKEIGDKMKLFLLFDREKLSLDKINSEALEYAINIYQELDTEDQLHSFLYRFPKSDVSDLNEILSTYDVPAQAVLSDSFVQLDRVVAPQKQIFSALDQAIDSLDYDFIFSFLFGLTLVYGHLDISQDGLKSAKIHIPLTGNLVGYQEILDKLKTLSKVGMFFKIDLINQKFGYVYQITITDWEILDNFVNYLQVINPIEKNLKYDKMLSIKDKFRNYAMSQHVDKSFIDKLDKGVFKYLEY